MHVLAEVAEIPYAGCGVIGLVNAIGKDTVKRLMGKPSMPVVRDLTLHADERPSREVVRAAFKLARFRQAVALWLVRRHQQCRD